MKTNLINLEGKVTEAIPLGSPILIEAEENSRGSFLDKILKKAPKQADAYTGSKSKSVDCGPWYFHFMAVQYYQTRRTK